MFCPKCGKPNEPNATRCEACGESLIPGQQTIQNTNTAPVPKKKNNGCLIAFIVVLGVFVFIIICGVIVNLLGQTDAPASVQEPIAAEKTISEADEVVKADEAGKTEESENGSESIVAEKAVNEEGKIGDYNVTIKESKLIQNGDKNYIVVTYTFVNNSKDSRAFSVTITDKLYQNGVGLENEYFSWGIEDYYNTDNQNKEIKPGVSLDVQRAYELNDTTTDIEVELSEWISFNDNKLVYTIKLS